MSSQISLSIPQIGLPDTTEDVKIANNFTTIQTAFNGIVPGSWLSLAASTGWSVSVGGGQVRQEDDVLRFRNSVQNTSGVTKTSGFFATLPGGVSISGSGGGSPIVPVNGTGTVQIGIGPSGLQITFGSVPNGSFIVLDGLTLPMT